MKNLILFGFLTACGYQSSKDEPCPQVAPISNPDKPTFAADIKPLMQKFCAQCHNDDTFIAQQEVFLTSKAPARIANKSMPQKAGKNYALWGDAERALVAKFVKQNQ